MLFPAPRKRKTFYRRDTEYAERTERWRGLSNWSDENHWPCGMRHAASGLERDCKFFCSDARGKLHHHVAHFAVLGIEDAGADGRAVHRHKPQLVTLVRGSRRQPAVVSHHSFLRIIKHARM